MVRNSLASPPPRSPPPPFCERWNFYKSADKGGRPTAAIDPLALDLKSDFRCAPIGRRRGQSSSVFGRLHACLDVG
ncbi:hypothetical protein HZB03_01055 [Candidatus Woesearchaeota archaeon]|nr:hypothetical protein [Candidatus Woesearchaeota archaeon]